MFLKNYAPAAKGYRALDGSSFFNLIENNNDNLLFPYKIDTVSFGFILSRTARYPAGSIKPDDECPPLDKLFIIPVVLDWPTNVLDCFTPDEQNTRYRRIYNLISPYSELEKVLTTIIELDQTRLAIKQIFSDGFAWAYERFIVTDTRMSIYSKYPNIYRHDFIHEKQELKDTYKKTVKNILSLSNQILNIDSCL